METVSRISNIIVKDNIPEEAEALFETDNIAEANLLRRAIMSEIETYAIHIVSFDYNSSSRHDSILAHRLGLLVINNENFVPDENGEKIVHIDVSGPHEFTTDDIPDLDFKYKTPIAKLRDGERVKCSCIVRKGTSKDHVKWRPVSTVTMKKVENGHGYIFNIKGIGMLDVARIFELGHEKIISAAKVPPKTLFFRPVVPDHINLE